MVSEEKRSNAQRPWGILWKLYWDVIPTDKYGNTKH